MVYDQQPRRCISVRVRNADFILALKIARSINKKKKNEGSYDLTMRPTDVSYNIGLIACAQPQEEHDNTDISQMMGLQTITGRR
jgi:hypothetical protein